MQFKFTLKFITVIGIPGVSSLKVVQKAKVASFQHYGKTRIAL